MYLEDLGSLRTDKDESKSCIFDWPDRPPDTLPPDFPPINPPNCYPYCEDDDWPPPIFNPPNPVIPPDVIPVVPPGLEFFNRVAGGGGCFDGANETTPYMKIQITGISDIGDTLGNPIFGSIPLDIYYGAEGNSSSYIVFTHIEAAAGGTTRIKLFDIDLIKLKEETSLLAIQIFRIRISLGQVKDPIVDPSDFPYAGSIAASIQSDTANSCGYAYTIPGFPIVPNPPPPPVLITEFYIVRNSTTVYVRGFLNTVLTPPNVGP